LKDEKNIDFESFPDFFKYGTFVKKEPYQITVTDSQSKEEVPVTRTRTLSKSFDLGKFSQQNIDLIFRKYW